VPWMHDRNALLLLEDALTRPQPDGRPVRVLRLSSSALKTFTAWQLEQGKDCARFGLSIVATNSFRLSPHWRALVEERYGAQVVDNYSLSEVDAPAPECVECGFHHFFGMPLIEEVLDVVTGQQRSSGQGRLVLTTVYPYVQTTPLVRYDTGDVVELGPLCPRTKTAGFRWLGRARRGICFAHPRKGEGLFLLAPAHVQDALDPEPHVERQRHPAEALGLVRTRELGLPRWEVSLDATRSPPLLQLRFEVRFEPALFPGESHRLEQRVGGELYEREPELAELIEEGLLSFDVTAAPAGSLSPLPDKHA
jgi:hypothetical protein